MFDVGIEGGTLVSSRWRHPANICVQDGVIAQLTSRKAIARHRVDAHGLLVMPGMVDAHVHFMDPSAVEREDFVAGSAAAARAGVTSVIEHSHSGPVRNVGELKEKLDYLTGRSEIDFALVAHAWPGEVENITPLWEDGAAFVKVFTCNTYGVPAHTPAELLQLFKAVSKLGAVALVHCEEPSLVTLPSALSGQAAALTVASSRCGETEKLRRSQLPLSPSLQAAPRRT